VAGIAQGCGSKAQCTIMIGSMAISQVVVMLMLYRLHLSGGNGFDGRMGDVYVVQRVVLPVNLW
jgi:hypothetical protein